MVKPNCYVHNTGHRAVKENCGDQSVNSLVDSLLSADLVNDVVSFIEFSKLGKLIAEGLDSADIGESFFSACVHSTLLGLNITLHSAHAPLVESGKDNERDNT